MLASARRPMSSLPQSLLKSCSWQVKFASCFLECPMEVPGQPDTATQGSIGCNIFSFSSDQLCELETIYCRGQSQEDDSAMVLILALLEASPEGFRELPAHVIKHHGMIYGQTTWICCGLLLLHSFHNRHQRSQQAPDLLNQLQIRLLSRVKCRISGGTMRSSLGGTRQHCLHSWKGFIGNTLAQLYWC